MPRFWVGRWEVNPVILWATTNFQSFMISRNLLWRNDAVFFLLDLAFVFSFFTNMLSQIRDPPTNYKWNTVMGIGIKQRWIQSKTYSFLQRTNTWKGSKLSLILFIILERKLVAVRFWRKKKRRIEFFLSTLLSHKKTLDVRQFCIKITSRVRFTGWLESWCGSVQNFA